MYGEMILADKIPEVLYGFFGPSKILLSQYGALIREVVPNDIVVNIPFI